MTKKFKNLQKKDFAWAYGSRGLESIMVEQSHNRGSKKLAAHILNWKHGTEKNLDMDNESLNS